LFGTFGGQGERKASKPTKVEERNRGGSRRLRGRDGLTCRWEERIEEDGVRGIFDSESESPSVKSKHPAGEPSGRPGNSADRWSKKRIKGQKFSERDHTEKAPCRKKNAPGPGLVGREFLAWYKSSG